MNLSRRARIRLGLGQLVMLLDVGQWVYLVLGEDGEVCLRHKALSADIILASDAYFNPDGSVRLGQSPAALNALAGYLDDAVGAGRINPHREVILPGDDEHPVYTAQ